jgi:2'-5' RNA ligase
MKDEKRLFLAINLPHELTERLAEFRGRLYDFPGKWTRDNNLHVTLAFLGNVHVEKIPMLVKQLESALSDVSPFHLYATKTSYNSDEVRSRKMIWVQFEKSTELAMLYKKIRTTLLYLPFRVHLQHDTITPHVTLCRFNSMHIREWHSNDFPYVEEEIGVRFKIGSVELMESRLRRGGAEYFVLQSFLLRTL